jgi:hypothetical protein
MKYELDEKFIVAGTPTELDSCLQTNPQTKRPRIATHTNIWPWLASFANRKELRVLEIGSRAVISDSLWKEHIPDCTYTGFDTAEGRNVNVVGDAHRLSDYFPPRSFDLVFSLAVFEHLAMPWIVAEEISKVLDINGIACIETHFSFSEHELPWHFFQFNANALEILFCEELGFETIDSGLDTPIVGRFAKSAPDYLRGQLVTDLWCHSSIIAKKTAHRLQPGESLDWREVARRVASNSAYPLNTGLSKGGN